MRRGPPGHWQGRHAVQPSDVQCEDLRKSAYSGMLFNGSGRPLAPTRPSPTLLAAMGGNATPIIDEEQFFGAGGSWVENLHAALVDRKALASAASEAVAWVAPESVRRLTVKEAARLQTFPHHYACQGGIHAAYKQIGNAVPCNFAYALAQGVAKVLRGAAPAPVATRQRSRSPRRAQVPASSGV